MTVLLSYSTSWCQNNGTSSMGGGERTDSLVLVPISALKIANAKMVELKYQKEINFNLNQIILNDSVVIEEYSRIIAKLNTENTTYKAKSKKYKTERNFFVGGSCLLLLFLIL